jgi:hypothetical protein
MRLLEIVLDELLLVSQLLIWCALLLLSLDLLDALALAVVELVVEILHSLSIAAHLAGVGSDLVWVASRLQSVVLSNLSVSFNLPVLSLGMELLLVKSSEALAV